MGSGKSSVGKVLSEAISHTFLDLDLEIEQNESSSITELFQKKGEIYFRKKEREVLEMILRERKNFVLSLGGGTPCFGNTMEFINEQEGVLTIYLKASNSILTDRLYAEKNQRPLIQHLSSKEGLNDYIRKHLFERGFYYNQAKQIVSVDEKEINKIVSEIVAKLF